MVRLLALGSLTQARLSALRALIEAELGGSGVDLVIESGAGAAAPWVERSQRDPGVLVMAVLDTRQANHWQIAIIDARRDRAIKRRLPGGVAEDAAALEAVASIVVSAVAALQDGLEVASQPVEEVLRDSEVHAEQPAAPSVPTPTEPARNSETPAVPREPAASEQWVVNGGVLGASASFAEAQSYTLGLGATLGVSWLSRLAVRTSAVRFRDAVFSSQFGEFHSTRTMLGLSVGPHFDIGPFELVPEARWVVEWNERRSAAAAPGVVALDAAVTSRHGALLGVLGRYLPGQHFGMSLLLGAGYLPRRVKYVTTPNNQVVAELWPWLLVAELGVELHLP